MNFLSHRQRIKVGEEYFDSLAELKRYNDLCDLQDSGAVKELARKVKFVLVPNQMEKETRTDNGVRIPGIVVAEKELVFRADFVYKTKSGKTIAEVRKGKEKSLEIKRTLMLWKYKAMVEEY